MFIVFLHGDVIDNKKASWETLTRFFNFAFIQLAKY